MIANMSGGDISLIVLAAFWGLLVLFLALVLLTMFRVLESTKLLIDGIRQETVPLLGEVKTTVSGVNRELDPRRPKIGTGQCRLCSQAGCVADKLHLDQQDDGGKDRQQEFHQDPIVPEQAPRGAQ